MIPERTRESLVLYVEHRIQPGHFLTAVLENDLFGAFNRADDENTAAMRHIVAYVYNYLPSGCWGSPRKVSAWLTGVAEEVA